MSGLDPSKNSILQISCFVTDYQLNFIETGGWGAIIGHPKETMDAMDEWCTKMHASTGLTAAVLASSMTPEQAASGLLEYIKQIVPEPRKALLAGNSIHADRSFLAKAPYDQVLMHLHYRLFDVSSMKEAARRWAPNHILQQVPRKKVLHEAKEDILESIAEAKFYKENFFET